MFASGSSNSNSNSSSHNNYHIILCLGSMAIGATAAVAVQTLVVQYRRKQRNLAQREYRRHAGAACEGNDLSLFYGDVQQLTTITDRQRLLSTQVYGTLVRDAVVCCVDIVLVRRDCSTSSSSSSSSSCRPVFTKSCLLVQRSCEPVQGVYWWPGGRLWKGETFFAAAVRKAHEETGIVNVRPIQILGVWNTFFPTSAWDNELAQGTQTVNAIVLVEIVNVATNNDSSSGSCDPDTNIVTLDSTSAHYRWISLDPELAVNEDRYVREALLRLWEWNPAYIES